MSSSSPFPPLHPRECLVHEFVCEHCEHEFDVTDLKFECHEKRSWCMFFVVVSIFSGSFLMFNLVGSDFGLLLLPYFSSDLSILNYSVYRHIELTVQDTVSAEDLAKIRRVKEKALQPPTRDDIQAWQSNILVAAFFVYGAHNDIFDGSITATLIWFGATLVAKVIKFIVGQLLGIVVFPGISRGATRLAVMYVYFRFPTEKALRALYGLLFEGALYIFEDNCIFWFKLFTWVNIVEGIFVCLFIPASVCAASGVLTYRKGHFCCACEKFRKPKCKNCGYTLDDY